MNERLTEAETEPENALKSTAAVERKSWIFILMLMFNLTRAWMKIVIKHGCQNEDEAEL